MSDRDRLLTYVVGGVIGLLLLFGVYRMVQGGFEAKRQTLSDRITELRSEQAINRQSKAAEKLVARFQQRTLVADTELAHLEFQHWLETQVKEVGLEKHRFNFDSIPRTKKDVKELSYLVTGVGNISQITDFLYRIHSADTLHRVRTLDLQKKKDGIQMTARIDAVSMPDIKGVEKVAIGTIAEAKLAMDLDAYNDRIATRNLFSPANQAPRFESLKTQTVEIGKSLSYRVEATDPEDHDLVFELDSDAPEWLDISKSGRLSGRPKEEGRFKFKIYCVDEGIPAQESVGELTLKVVPQREGEPEPESEDLDESKLAVLTAIVQGARDPLPQMCMYLRSKDESQYLQKGDKLRIGEWKGQVVAVDPDTNTVLLQNDDGEFELRLGDALADARKIRKPDQDDDAEEDERL